MLFSLALGIIVTVGTWIIRKLLQHDAALIELNSEMLHREEMRIERAKQATVRHKELIDRLSSIERSIRS